MKIAVIGGGAAGFFSAIAAKENHPNAKVTLFEQSTKLLSKVKISGGGRCNVTNGTTSIKELSAAYPRGSKQLKKAFQLFNTKHTLTWFESRGIPLYVQESNNCVFPVSQSSQSIIDCFLAETKKLGIAIKVRTGVKAIHPLNNALQLQFTKNQTPQLFDKVIVATGGSPSLKGLQWLANLNHKIEKPVPSLFTFNMPNEAITKLMGVSVNKVLISIQGTKLKATGALLITHWGMSGPAVLKLSAFGARILSELNYQFKVQINWANLQNSELVTNELSNIIKEHPSKALANVKAFALPERLWYFLLEKSNLPLKKKWGELGKKGLNKLTTTLSNDVYSAKGKTTFKEEFVTCGGISLDSVDFRTMESKVCKNLYFSGEILDIDGITGGYNFQAAWTTGFIAGKLNSFL